MLYEVITKEAKSAGAVVTAEDHNVIGGLGDAVASVLMEEGVCVPFRKVAVADTFCETGSASQLFEKYGP